MKTSIHQASFFPWLGLLHKIAKSEQFIFLDDVHASKSSFQYRNIFYCNGQAKYITLPVNYSSKIKLNELEFKNNTWRIDHINKIKNYYYKAPFFYQIYPLLEKFYINFQGRPIDFLIQSMEFLFEIFNINVQTIRSSSINYEGTKGDLVFDICRKTNTTIYLSGIGGKNYMDESLFRKFEDNNIKIEWNNFVHPEYEQNNKYSFLIGLSALDILFFNGIEKSKKIFWNNIY